MSWGYFLDLNLTLPTAEWTRLAQTKTGDHAVPPEWWGFQELALAQMFGGSAFDDMTIGSAIELFARPESIGTVTSTGDHTTLRLCQLLDRGGDPSLAKSVAALVEGAKSTARGTLRLVNDGSYAGEDGIAITIDRGSLSRHALEDGFAIASKLGAEIFGVELDGDDETDDAKPA